MKWISGCISMKTTTTKTKKSKNHSFVSFNRHFPTANTHIYLFFYEEAVRNVTISMKTYQYN